MTEPVYDAWVFGRARGGTLAHAVKRNRLAAETFTVSSLCGVRGGLTGLIATNTHFDPAADPTTGEVCAKCARRWTARQAPIIEGWTKRCDTCATDKPINQFHVDRRTTDNLSKTCLDCADAARAAVREAERLIEREADRQRVIAASTERHTRELEVLARFQDSSLLPTFTCTAGHTLAPDTTLVVCTFRFTTELPRVAWTCPCGTAVAEGIDWGAVYDAVRALDTIAATAAPEAVHVVASDLRKQTS